MPSRSRLFLAGDIGGTKTKLAVFDPKAGPRHPIAEGTFPSSHFPSLEALVSSFLEGKGWSISLGSFGIAGPVTEGRVQVTNLDWVDDERSLSASLKFPVHLINDLVAIAYAVPHLESADLLDLNDRQAAPEGALAVIAPGTGLGEAYLVWDHDHFVPGPSEGGHADFAPTSPLEIDLLTYLLLKHSHVSYESVCSGLGLPNLYAFLKDTLRYPEPDWLAREFTRVVDPTPTIVQAAVAGRAEICSQAVRLFVSILGSEAGNLALKVYATGGVFLSGGMPGHILPFLKEPGFLQAFTAKGRFADRLERIPVKIIINPDAGLMGAAFHGMNIGWKND